MNTSTVAKNLTAGQRFILNGSGTVYTATRVVTEWGWTCIEYNIDGSWASRTIIAGLVPVELV